MNFEKVILLSKRDRIGLSIFLACGIAIQMFLYLDSLRKLRKTEKILIQQLSTKSVDTLPEYEINSSHSKNLKPIKNKAYTKHESKAPEIKLPLDPNTADSTSLLSLGLKPFTVRNLISYRNTGAVFKSMHELSKIYGMDSVQLYTHQDAFIFPVQTKPQTLSININLADSTELQKLVGIGPVLSARTIRYRNALGGFIKIEQIKEVYGIDPDFLIRNASHIYCSGEIRQLDLNEVNEDILRRHPYIDYKTASRIIRYREQHGVYKTVDALKSIHLLKDSIFEKIQPYCVVKRNN